MILAAAWLATLALGSPVAAERFPAAQRVAPARDRSTPTAGATAAEAVSRGSLPPAVRAAVEAVLECERPGGGWTYVCNPPTGPYGVVTKIMIRAGQIAAPLGLDDWDVLVLRSPGTPAGGLVMLDAARRSGERRYLEAARRAGDLLVDAQLPSGGWASEMPVHGAHLAGWFRVLNQWTALDDDVTSGAARFLLELWRVTGDVEYRAAAERALDLLVATQLPDGAWPLTRRPALLARLSPSFEDLPSTNDAATAGPIEALLAGARLLARRDYLEAARRGGQWLLRAQGPDSLAGWAQQYDAVGRPGPGRRFEPPGYAAWESREMAQALLSLAGATGERRFCEGAERAAGWLARSAIAPGIWSRLYDPTDGAPLYVGKDGARVASPEQARRPYKWTGDFGIPGLLAELGLGPDGRPLAAGAGRAPRRMLGDAGAGLGRPALEDAPDDENPRARIVRAAVLLQALDPRAPSVCAPDGLGRDAAAARVLSGAARR